MDGCEASACNDQDLLVDVHADHSHSPVDEDIVVNDVLLGDAPEDALECSSTSSTPEIPEVQI